MSSILVNARKRRLLGLAALALFIILLISVSGSSSSSNQYQAKVVETTPTDPTDDVIDSQKLVSEQVVLNSQQGQEEKAHAEELNSKSKNSPKESKVEGVDRDEPIKVNTKKLINGNDIVKDQKSGEIDESKVKMAEENGKKPYQEIPLVAGNSAAVAIAASRAQKSEDTGNKVAGDKAGAGADKVAGSDDSADVTSAPGAIKADMQLRTPRKKSSPPAMEDEDGAAKKVEETEQEETASADEGAAVDSGKFDPAREYQEILQLSPVIIFSKTYCPYSKGLKELLKTSYEITPSPTIVELDMHESGAELQKYIYKKTGRKTVPNLIVNGVSHGGYDDILKLHHEGRFVSEFTKWADHAAKVEKINAPSNS